jgi:hypothetical protein
VPEGLLSGLNWSENCRASHVREGDELNAECSMSIGATSADTIFSEVRASDVAGK